MTQKEIYEKCRCEASKKYRDEINYLKEREDKFLNLIKELEAENKRLKAENALLQEKTMRFNGNPVLTNVFEEITKLNSIM